MRARRVAALAIPFTFLVLHLPFLAPSLEDIDSINFALGLRDFDVAGHQPHPPGYPVYIALGRMSLAVVNGVAPALGTVHAEALALAVWSALAGAVALAAAASMFASLGGPRGTTAWAAALLACSPLFWISGLRPMSDLPGLALALTAQALVLHGARTPATAGAFVAGLAAGVRIQTLLLTAPVLILVGVGFRGPRTGDRTSGIRGAMASLAAFAAGILIWLVPLVAASGGPSGYLRALSTQAGEDFAWVDMLWANPTPRRLAFSLYETLVLPWSAVPLAAAAGIAALAGAVLALRQNPRALLVLGAAFGPYFLFHLLLQETFTVRYALPLLPPVAWLAARGVMALGQARHAAAAAVVVPAAILSVPAGVAYARESHPAFRAIADMRDGAGERPDAIHAHYSMRRPLQASAPLGVPVIEPPRQAEWLGLADYWRGGGDGVVWFLADPRRTDLDLVDRRAHRLSRYRWAVGERAELTGTRPLGVDWYRFEPPFWFAGEGWSLTPETGGVARASGAGLDLRPIDAYVRRHPGPLRVMVGGGFTDPPSVAPAGDATPPVAFELAIDGETAAEWRLLPQGDGRFLHFFDVPGGTAAGPGNYATLTIRARASGGAPAAVAVRQFDVQPADRIVYGFGEGWHEEEYDQVTGRRWRWTSDRAVIRVAPATDVRVVIRGESPLRYLDGPPNVRVTAGGRTISSFQPGGDFTHEAIVPRRDVAASGGAIAIEVDRVYLPAEAEGSADTRRLGLRLFEAAAHPVTP